MKPIRRILFAVKEPGARSQPGLDKAITLARRLGATLELFHALSTPVFLEIQPFTGAALADAKRETRALSQRRLEQLAARARKQDVTASCTVEWDYPPHEAIARRALHSGADLIIAACHKGHRTAPWLIHLTDWELVRTSTVPVLLIRNTRAWRERPIILAAVDPSHARAKPARLDSQIATEAERFADDLSGRLHLMHANYPAMFGITPMDPVADGAIRAATIDQAKAQRQRAFEKFAKGYWIPRKRRHLVDDDPVHAIPAVAQKLGADLVVMGAVARSGLKRVFIGNTAERVLGALPCDVLVIRPLRFRKRIAAAARGIRVIAPPPFVPLAA